MIVTIRDNKDYIRVLFYSYYTTITGWGVLLTGTCKGYLDTGRAVTEDFSEDSEEEPGPRVPIACVLWPHAGSRSLLRSSYSVVAVVVVVVVVVVAAAGVVVVVAAAAATVVAVVAYELFQESIRKPRAVLRMLGIR